LKYPYGKFIKECATFHNIVRIEDKVILGLIEQKYRLNFFKDSIIVEWIGDQPESIFNKVFKVSTCR